jgi:hypothetical protein
VGKVERVVVELAAVVGGGAVIADAVVVGPGFRTATWWLHPARLTSAAVANVTSRVNRTAATIGRWWAGPAVGMAWT